MSLPAGCSARGECPDKFGVPGHVQPLTSVTSRGGTWPGTDVGALDVFDRVSALWPPRLAGSLSSAGQGRCQHPEDLRDCLARIPTQGGRAVRRLAAAEPSEAMGGASPRPIDGEGGTLTYRQ